MRPVPMFRSICFIRSKQRQTLEKDSRYFTFTGIGQNGFKLFFQRTAFSNTRLSQRTSVIRMTGIFSLIFKEYSRQKKRIHY